MVESSGRILGGAATANGPNATGAGNCRRKKIDQGGITRSMVCWPSRTNDLLALSGLLDDLNGRGVGKRRLMIDVCLLLTGIGLWPLKTAHQLQMGSTMVDDVHQGLPMLIEMSAAWKLKIEA